MALIGMMDLKMLQRLIPLLFILALSVPAASLFRAPRSEAMAIPAEGLILHYPFDGSAEDASGHGNHAVLRGAMLAEDKFGNARSAYYLNGRGAHLVAPVCISPSVMPQVTMVVWVKAEKSTRMATLLSNAARGRGRELSMRPSSGRGGCWATSTNTRGSWVWEEVKVGEWTFLAISYDQAAKQLRLHVNDNTYEAECSTVDGRTMLTIGRHPHMRGRRFHGFIDELRVYDRVLTEKEIAALYHHFLHGNDGAAFHAIGRHGLKLAIIAGFSLFVAMVFSVNLWIRR